MPGALILTGAPGSGKSSVLDALSTLLEIDEIPFSAIETEQFSRGWPWLSAAEWLPQLEAVIQLQRRVGRHTFLIVATTETEQELRGVVNAVNAEPVAIVCLEAPAELAARRVAEREPDSWPGKPDLVAHARTLADTIPALAGIDASLPTADRDPEDVALEIRALMTGMGIIPAPNGG
jgi:chloramphenicol 3-O-phosphotransferase